MDKTYLRIQKTKKKVLSKRLYAVVCLLLIASILVSSATYAWLVLSKAPEVKNVSATVGANGNLEIALATADHLNRLKANGMYDDDANTEATNGELLHDNLLWGNMVDLNSSDYGLSSMNMRPVVLNVLDGRVADAPVSAVSYGSDGRTENLITDIDNPNIKNLGFTGIFSPAKGGCYAGSLSMSVNDLKNGNYDKKEVIQSLLNQREYGVRIAGLLDFAGTVDQEQTTANIDLMLDGYCFAIDMLFRTNAPNANLLLQTDGTQRVDDEDYEYVLDFTGEGSYMEVGNTKLSTAMRFVFADTITGEVYALAQPDLQGRLWLTARLDENGNLDVVDPGEDQVIKPLTENQVSAITAWVYIDGTQVDNSYASILASDVMKMNLQFATDIDLTPAIPDGNGVLSKPHQVFPGDTYVFGKYEQDNVLVNGREPIEWQVLAVEKSKALLVSKSIIDALPYDSSYWNTSAIREWLNGTFVDWAFTKEQQKALMSTNMNPDDSREHRLYDRVFFLSEGEVYTYSSYFDKYAEPTAYAINNDVERGVYEYYWWLRGTLYDGAPNEDRLVKDIDDHNPDDYSKVGIRPALWINLDESEKVKPGISNEPVQDPLPGAVSNPRLELVNNGIALNFDYPKYYTGSHPSLDYSITFTDSSTGAEYVHSTNSNKAVLSGLSSPFLGTYDRVTIDTVFNNETTATANFKNLKLTVTEDENLSENLYLRLYPSNKSNYYFSLFGLAPNTTFLLYTASARDALGGSEGPQYSQVVSATTDAYGHCYGFLDADQSIVNLKDNPGEIEEPTKLYFKVVELTDYYVAENGRNASFVMNHINNWTQYTPGGTGDNPETISKTVGNISWTYTQKDSTLRISGSGDMTYNSAQSWKPLRNEITNIIIEEGVTSIYSSAFSNAYYDYHTFHRLTSVSIPSSITSIESYSFYNCNNLTSVHINDMAAWCNIMFDYNYQANPLYYAENLYLNGKLVTDLVIPDSVTAIRSGTFYNCDSLTSVIIPDSVTSIGTSAFMGCNGMTSVTIGNGVTSIGDYAFCDCDGLTTVTIPDSVTSIESHAFRNCDSLTSITIPDSVTSISSYTFYDCDGLTSVTIGNGVTSIGDYAFYDCDGLTTVTIPNSVTSVGDYAFYGCDGLTTVTIPNSVTSVGDYAFYGCDGLTSVTIGNGVTSIGSATFRNCTKLTTVTIGNGVTSIGDYAFYGCDGLTSVTIPDSVIFIESGAFRDCTNLTSVTIPVSVISIRDYAFDDCYSLTDVYCNGSKSQWDTINIGSYNDALTNATIHYAVEE